MAIGVPRVPYKTPGENTWQWIDIWNIMYRERIVFVGKYIDEELGNQLVGTLLYLDSIDENKDINLYINSQGGEIVPSLCIYDTCKHCKSDVGAVSFGASQAMAGFLLATAAKGKRAVLPNTNIMLHQPSGSARGQAIDIYNEARELLRVRRYMNECLAQATGKTREQIQKRFARDAYFEAEAAQEYGLIDTIVYPTRQMGL